MFHCVVTSLHQPTVGSPFSSNVMSYNGSHGSPPAAQPFQPPGAPPFAQQPQAFQQPMHAPASSQVLSSATPGVAQSGSNFYPPPSGAGFQPAVGANHPPGQPFPRDPPSLPSTKLPGAMSLPQRPVFPGPQSQGPLSSAHVQAPSHAGLRGLQASGESQMGVNGQTAGHPGGTTIVHNGGVALGATPSAINSKPVDPGKNAEAISAAKKIAAEVSVDKKSNNKKDRSIKLIYSDNDVSPEEKMAVLPRYAFEREKREAVLGTVTASVTGIAAGPDDVIDKQG